MTEFNTINVLTFLIRFTIKGIIVAFNNAIILLVLGIMNSFTDTFIDLRNKCILI